MPDLTPEEESELARLEAAFEELGGRGVEMAERIDRLTAKRDWDGTLGCPECGSTSLATIEQILGTAPCTVNQDGTIDWGGHTDVNWDSSETVGFECLDCGWEDREHDPKSLLKPPYEVER